jgi:hypothetical protein
MDRINQITSIIILSSLLSSFSTDSHEINSHQAQMLCAITPEANACSDSPRATNLHYLVGKDGLGIQDSSYLGMRYEDYAIKGSWHKDKDGKPFTGYIQYAEEGEEEFKKWGIKFSNSSNYLDMLQVGVILEDALWPGADPLLLVVMADSILIFSTHNKKGLSYQEVQGVHTVSIPTQ